MGAVGAVGTVGTVGAVAATGQARWAAARARAARGAPCPHCPPLLAASWQRYTVALESDVSDVPDGTTAEGIHLGVTSGTLDLVQRSSRGEVIRAGVLSFAPKPMDQLRELPLPMRFRGLPIAVALDTDHLRVCAAIGSLNVHRSIPVVVGEQALEVRPKGP